MPVKSMTGYGSARFVLVGENYTVSVRAVNHRHLDIRARIPSELQAQEPRLRQLAAEYVQRGHLDLTVGRSTSHGAPADVEVRHDRAREVKTALERLRDDLGFDDDVTLGHVLSFEGVVETVPRDLAEDEAWGALEPAFRKALEGLDVTRAAEGARLATDLSDRLDRLETLVGAVEKRAPDIVTEHRERLRQRVSELLNGQSGAAEERVEAEIVLAGERGDVTEELVRLRSHIEALRQLLDGDSEEAVGRRLEFLSIELNRELNTIASKAGDTEVAQLVVEGKAEVERVREQAANLE